MPRSTPNAVPLSTKSISSSFTTTYRNHRPFLEIKSAVAAAHPCAYAAYAGNVKGICRRPWVVARLTICFPQSTRKVWLLYRGGQDTDCGRRVGRACFSRVTADCKASEAFCRAWICRSETNVGWVALQSR